MTHDLDTLMDWCRRCGRPYLEIFDGDLTECDGLSGVVHQRFLRAKAEMEKTFGPIVDAVMAYPTSKSEGEPQ
jgi:hypothetical protein